MTDKEYIEKEKEKLLNFCHNHKRIFIYGAGNYGRGYLDVLQNNHIWVDGFLVTNPGMKDYCGIKVYTVDNASLFLQKGDGVIPAFTNSVPEEIQKKFKYTKPDILSFDHKVMLCLDNEIRFYPIMDKLNAECSQPGSLNEKKNWKTILIVRLDAIGDMIFTTPFFRELRRNFPSCRILAVIRKVNAFLLKDCPYLDQVFLYESEQIEGELSDQCRSIKQVDQRVRCFVEKNLMNISFDAVFFPRAFLCGRNALEELLLGFYSHASCRIGRMIENELENRLIYDKVQKSFSILSRQEQPMHEVAYTLKMLEECGCKIEQEEMELWPNQKCRAFAEKVWGQYHIEDDEIVVALGLVASVPTRTWEIGNYQELIQSFYKKYGNKWKFLLLGGQDAVEAAKKLEENKAIINLAGKTRLDQTAALMEKCRLYVGSNTGLLHFASACGKPSVTIYSALTDGKSTDGDNPFRMGAWKVKHFDLVPPPGLDGCHGVCRMGKSHCINQIRPLQVMEAMEKLIN